MSAETEITTLLNQYAYRVDTGDLDGFLDLFETGEWSVEGSTVSNGRQELFDNVISNIIIYDDGTPKTRHVTANISLDIDESAGTASGQRYVTVLQQTDKLPLQTIFSGHYFDEFVKENGRWRFARTLVRHPLVGDMSAHLTAAL